MKVLIGQKNSRWKVVQNPLKGNYYTDVIDFRNDAEKEQFLNENFYMGWKNFNDPAYIEIPIIWTDEIHGTFTIDLEETGFSRYDALRKDFAVIYDDTEKRYIFITLEASLNDKQTYTTISFNFELDVFFNYGISKIWKQQAQVTIERGVFKNQWKNPYTPNTDLGSLISQDEVDTALVLESSITLDDSDIKGYILYMLPKRRFLKVNTTSQTGSFVYEGLIEDTILLGEYPSTILNNNNVQTQFLILDTDANNHVIYSVARRRAYRYPEAQQFNETKKSDAIVPLFYRTSGVTYDPVIKNITNSPDLVRIEPVNYYPEGLKSIKTPYMGMEGDPVRAVKQSDPDQFYFQDLGSYSNLELITSMSSTFKASLNTVSPFFRNNLSSTLYDPQQYAKMLTGAHRKIYLFNGKMQQFVLSPELYKGNSVIHVQRKKKSTVQGSFALTTFDEVDNSNYYTSYAWQEDITLTRWQTTDTWLTYASQNAQSINTANRINQINLSYTGELNRLDRAQVNREGVDIPIGSIIDTVKGLFGGSITGGGKRVLDWETHSVTADYNRASLLNDIKTQAASLADQASGRTIIVDKGGDYERLNALASAWGFNVQIWSVQGELYNKTAWYYHLYGYKCGIVDSPLNWLNNGLYWDYFKANFDSVYQGLNESVSPQEAKIIALSLSEGVRIWHWRPDLPNTWEVGNYNFRNVQS